MLVFVSFSHFYLFQASFVKKLDLQFYDVSTLLLKHQKTDINSSVVIVDIDEKSLATLGQWPWPRIMLAQLINKINVSNPSVIGVDILLPEKDRTSPQEIRDFYKQYFHIDVKIKGLEDMFLDNDAILAQAISNSQSVTSYFLNTQGNAKNKCENLYTLKPTDTLLNLHQYSSILCNTRRIEKASKIQGFVNKYVDSDGILRKLPLIAKYKNKLLPSFPIAVLLGIDPAMSYSEEGMKVLNHTIKFEEDAEVLLHFYQSSWYRKISAVDLLFSSIDEELFRGKIVLIGSSSVALHDRVIIPQSKEISGVLVNATVIGNVLDDTLIQQPKYFQFINIFLSFLLSVILSIILLKKSRIWIVILFVVLLVFSYFYVYYYLSNYTYVSIGYLLVPFLLHFFLINLLSIVFDVLEKKIYAEELSKSQIALFDSMVHVAEAHDMETGEHIVRTKKYVSILATTIMQKGLCIDELTLRSIKIMEQTSALHDIGKVGISDLILKKPGKLTQDEFTLMKTHADLGKHIIDNAISSYKENDFFKIARNIVYCHHEKYDGTGYPRGLVGKEIPLEARIMALADVYDALVSKRIYKKAFSYEQTRQIIISGAYTHFDPVVVDAFIHQEEEFKKISDKYADKYLKEKS